MSKVKIKPLRSFEELDLKIASRKEINLGNSNKANDILSKLIEEARKIPGAILSMFPIEGQSAVAASFKSKQIGQLITLPEPNPVLIYFKIALGSITEAKAKKKEFSKLENTDIKNRYSKFIEYFEKASSGIIFLVTTVEAFFNQIIPENINLKIDNKELDKEQIEWMDLKTKLKVILPLIEGKDFLNTRPQDYNNILEIQNLRDDLIHLKTEELENKTSYQELFKLVHEIDFDKYVSSIEIFVNTIRASLIETE